VSTVPPIRREVLVDAGPEAAFDVFTAGIGRWWPIAELSGWDAFADPAAARAEYDHGWPIVLGRYQEQAGRPGTDAGHGGGASHAGESGRQEADGLDGDSGLDGDGASRPGWRCCTAPARPHRRTARYSTTRGSPSMSRS